MGVTLLNRFIEENNVYDNFFLSGQTCKIKKVVGSSVIALATQNVVIDGVSLCHRLYHAYFHRLAPGQYGSFIALLTRYLETLKICGFNVCAICFHGGRLGNYKFSQRIVEDRKVCERVAAIYDELRKNPTVPLTDASQVSLCKIANTTNNEPRFRNTDIRVLPLLLDKIAFSALAELGYNVAIAHGQCDSLAAGIANKFNAAVIADDSDYAIYPISGGYIPLSSLLLNEAEGHASGRIVKHTDVTTSLGLGDIRLLPLFAAAVGCTLTDSRDLSERLYQIRYSPAIYQSVVDSINLVSENEKIPDNSRAYYHNDDKRIAEAFVMHWGGHSAWVECFLVAIASFRPTTTHAVAPAGDIHGFLIDAIESNAFFCRSPVESPSFSSAWLASRPLRAAAYFRSCVRKPGKRCAAGGFVGRSCRTATKSVNEYMRKECGKIVAQAVDPSVLRDETVFIRRGRGMTLTQMAVRYLVKRGLLSVRLLLVTALASCATASAADCSGLDADEIGSLRVRPEQADLLALLETTIISASMLWLIPISIHQVIDPWKFSYFDTIVPPEITGSVFCYLQATCEQRDFLTAVINELREMTDGLDKTLLHKECMEVDLDW